MKWSLYPAAELAAHAGDWRALNARGADSPLLDPDFFDTLLRVYGSGRERLAFCESGGRLVAAAIVQPHGAGAWQTFQPSQAPLGPWLAADGTPFDALLRTLMRALPGMPLMLGLTQQDPLHYARPTDSARLRTLDYIETAHIAVTGSFDDYWNARSKNLRHNMKRRRNRLLEQGVTPRLEEIVDAAAIPSAVRDYGRLESAGWKAQHGTAIGADNDQGRLYTDLLVRFAARGEARVYRYSFGEKLVAMELCVCRGGALVLLKSTYDETEGTHAPAMLMRQDIFRRAFESGAIRRIEFYGRVLEWQRQWISDVRTLYHVNCYRWSLLPSALRWVGACKARLRRTPAPPAAAGAPD